ncbi:MAG: cobalamin-dependent protein [Candidatus Micrarchaeota archaeon]|nr:cobalamin-dependent protein [Candidatus Micrarchaeota archaeon]
MKVMLSTTPMNTSGSAFNLGPRPVRPSTGMVYLASMLGKQEKLGFGSKVADVMLEEPNLGGMRFLSRVEKFAPDIFGFTPYEFNLEKSKELCALVKAASPGTLVFVGGPLATLVPQYVGEFVHADAVFRGEADFTFRKAVEHLKGGGRLEDMDVEGVLPMKGGKPVETAGSKIIPRITQAQYRMIEPDISLLAAVTMNVGYDKMDFAFSRGCPSKPICSFCQISPVAGNKSLETGMIIRILKQLAQIPGIKSMIFGDAMFGNGKEGAIRLMREIKREGISFEYGFSAEWSVDMLLKAGEKGKREVDLEMLNLMSLVPIRGELGLESLSESQLAKFNKGRHTYDEVKRVLSSLRKYGIFSTGGIFLFGFDSTCSDVIETIERAFDIAYGLGKERSFEVAYELGAAPFSIADHHSPFIGTGEYAKYMEAMEKETVEAMCARVLMGKFHMIEKTGDINYPFFLKESFPLHDMLLQRALIERIQMDVKLALKGKSYPSLGLFMDEGAGNEAHLLKTLLAIRKVARAEDYPQSGDVLAKANRALESICKNDNVLMLAMDIEMETSGNY